MRLIRILSFVFALFIALPLSGQPLNRQVITEKGDTMLLGLSNRAGLTASPFQSWFTEYYDAYEPSPTLVKKCKPLWSNTRVEIFMGTWCGDSKREVPRFYKILDEIGVSEADIRLVNLDNRGDNYKQGPHGEEKGKLIHRVPTFIVYQGENEIGRIVEFPHTSLEMDLAQILAGLPSDPEYKVVPMVAAHLEGDTIPSDWKSLLEIARAVYKNSKNHRELNTFGYVLLRAGELDKALAVFRINTLLFRNEPNVFDSLGEAYVAKEAWEQAQGAYKMVLKLAPEDENALEQLALVEAKIDSEK
ncbi:MAG: hypothetical protein AAFR61_05615 [Bacteroidota bacterium]